MSKLILLFPEIAERHYYQDPETKEFWFHATGVCSALGFTNVGRSLQAYTDEDERYQDIHNGRTVWFVSESGCYGLAMAAKTDSAKKFKRWLKHEVLPKLRAEGGYILPSASTEQLEALHERIAEQQDRIALLEQQKAQSDAMLLKGATIQSEAELLASLKQFSRHWRSEYNAKNCSEKYYLTMHTAADYLCQQLVELGASAAAVQTAYGMLLDFAPRLASANVIDWRDMDSIFLTQIEQVFREDKRGR